MRNPLSKSDAEKLIHAFVTSRLDYCNSLLAACPKSSLRSLQLVQNAAARLEKIIAVNMAKMSMVLQKEEKARPEKLLAEARERFGFSVDRHSLKFLEMVTEIEKEEKKKKKLLKRRLREEQAAGLIPTAPS
uniref:Uncharacterized protein n=1 Tax=Oryzias latipes TaxID=8090 RepID=A0A3P9JH97_ORYLA